LLLDTQSAEEEEVVLDLQGSSCQNNMTIIQETPVHRTPDAAPRHNPWSLEREDEDAAYNRKCKLFEAALASLTADCLRFTLDDFKPTQFKQEPGFFDFASIEKPSQVKKMSYIKEARLEAPT
jgi:hypothetical protein